MSYRYRGDDRWAILKLASGGTGPRLGVKDLIDVEGTITSAGSRLIYSLGHRAEEDAELIKLVRSNGAQISAKTNLTEFAFGATGINPWFGTPLNPRNDRLIPGGSSSGSATGLFTGEIDLSLGSDTGGSIRIPSACCGVFGLKTTFGRIPLQGVWPLAPSFDTVGPMALSSHGIELGMKLLEASFAAKAIGNPKIAVIEGSGSVSVLRAISEVCKLVSSSVEFVPDLGLPVVWEAGMRIMFFEALQMDGEYLSESHRLDPAMMTRFQTAFGYQRADISSAWSDAKRFKQVLMETLERFDFLALPTLKYPVPNYSDAYKVPLNANTIPFNVAGLPAISIPIELTPGVRHVLGVDAAFTPYGVESDGITPLPLSIQLVGANFSEENLVGLAKEIESATLAL